MLIQLIALSETSKYSAAVVEMDEKVNHYISDMISNRSCITQGPSREHAYIPANHDIQQHQLSQAPEPPLIDLVGRPGVG